MKSATNNSNDSSNNKNNSKSNLKRSNSNSNPKQKSKKSISVTSNNNSPPVTATPAPQTPPVATVKNPIKNEASTSSHGKEKHHHEKIYAGISSKFVKCIWEQHDKTDTEVGPEVYSRLAEDVTYKLWELANNIKTYLRHSGGLVTFDLVNEILKDSNVPPIVGAGDSNWDKIEYDRTYYFNSDKIVDLANEYLEEMPDEQIEPLSLTSLCMADSGISSDLLKFYDALRESIYFGPEKDLKFTLDIISSNPHMASLIKPFFKKSIEQLAMIYTDFSLERTLKTLCALSVNPYVGNNDVLESTMHLVQILIDLLLGPTHFINTLHAFVKEEMESQESKPVIDENLDSEMHEPTNNNSSPPENLFKSENSDNKTSQMSDIEKQCNELLLMMESSDFGKNVEPNDNILDIIKKETPDETENENFIKIENPDYVEQLIEETPPVQLPKRVVKIKSEDLKGSNITTMICDSKSIDLVVKTIGMMCNKWGVFEEQLNLLLSSRMETFFGAFDDWFKEDFKTIERMIKCIFAVGEFAFREFSVFLEKIDPSELPESLKTFFNCTAVFIRGLNDIYIYEWLYEFCGDGIHPFMIYFQKKLQKLGRKHGKAEKTEEYKFSPKISIKTIPKPIKSEKKWDYKNIFEDHVKFVNPVPSKFGFKFAGCVNVSVNVRACECLTVKSPSVEHFNKNVIIAKKKMLKSVTNLKRKAQFVSLYSINL